MHRRPVSSISLSCRIEERHIEAEIRCASSSPVITNPLLQNGAITMTQRPRQCPTILGTSIIQNDEESEEQESAEAQELSSFHRPDVEAQSD